MAKNTKKPIVPLKKDLEKALGGKLTDKQEMFCRLYALSKQHRGNATRCYADAYGKDITDEKQKLVSEAAGCRLLTNVKVMLYIHSLNIQLAKQMTLTPEDLDAQLTWLVLQNENLHVKRQAIMDYNLILGRVKNVGEVNIDNIEINFNVVRTVKKVKSETVDV